MESCEKETMTPCLAVKDTTTQAFVWTVDTIGAEGSVLYDCAVINDTLAYAVGLIMPGDSVLRSNADYWQNAAVWNGSKWTTMQIPFTYQGNRTFFDIHAVYAHNANDIWFGAGNLAHWNGYQFSQVDLLPWFDSYENKIWASPDGNKLYVVGIGGHVAHSADHGVTWEPVATSTTMEVQDVWGGVDSKTGEQQVIAIASDKFGIGGKYLCSLSGNQARTLNDSVPGAVSISGIWFIVNQAYYLVGDGVYEKRSFKNQIWQMDTITPRLGYYQYAIRGNAQNDIFIGGERGTISHFNGSYWKTYTGVGSPYDRLLSLSIMGRTVIAVGVRNYDGIHFYGVIYHGRR